MSVMAVGRRCSGWWSAVWSGWVAVLLLVGVCLALAPPADADEWVQVTCTAPDGAPAPVEGWQGGPYGVAVADSGPIDTCDQHGGALTAYDSSAVQAPAYTGAIWVYTASAGSTIAGGVLSVSLSTPQGQAFVATPQDAYNAANVVINCQYNEPCGADGTETASVSIAPTFAGGSQLFAAAMCVSPTYGGTTCPAGSGGGTNATISVYSADIELQNSATPTGAGFAGTLLSPGASGTAELTFTAQDHEGPGVYRVIVDLDGAQVYAGTPETNGGRCASIGTNASGISEFLYAQPCKQDVAVDVPMETTRFADGQHQLKVTVQDAAGNTAVVYDGTISIANPTTAPSTTIGPGSPLAERGSANGTNASDQAKLTARWASTTKATRTSRYGQADRVTGRLTSTTGQPISGALLDATETPAVQGAKTASLTSVRTGPTGTWTLTLPRDVSSSTLRIAYHSHINDTVPAATTSLELHVHAGIILRITPHITSVNHTIHFSGTLHGTPIPPGGKQLVLEASSGGEWIQFDTISTNAKGRYHASYRFKFPGPVTYRFRVLSPYEADFPFLAGSSNAVAVYER
ncbi:MAG: hypothetical protein ACLP7W_10720 [Solirubrobacteraceae bacterium]